MTEWQKRIGLEPDRPRRAVIQAGAHPCDGPECPVPGCDNKTGDEGWNGCNLCGYHEWSPRNEFPDHVCPRCGYVVPERERYLGDLCPECDGDVELVFKDAPCFRCGGSIGVGTGMCGTSKNRNAAICADCAALEVEEEGVFDD
ncbi:hypothetical protein [Natrinema salinisoli]|uniref:hypothetical protein n=1 Tax=Natrinema salinisoli TaxID=2878535 RepID=UPI001CF086A6|nr:hypothetical protein [Natrinema salinisoli]